MTLLFPLSFSIVYEVNSKLVPIKNKKVGEKSPTLRNKIYNLLSCVLKYLTILVLVEQRFQILNHYLQCQTQINVQKIPELCLTFIPSP
jgi:hypothetical protein